MADVYGVDDISSYASVYVIKSVLDILTIERQRLEPKTGKGMNLRSSHVRLYQKSYSALPKGTFLGI